MPIIEDFLVNLAAGFTQTLLMALGRRVLGDPQQRALKRAYQAGFKAMLRTAGSGLSQAELAVVGNVIGRFLGQPTVAQALLDLGLAGAPLDVPALAARWNDAGGPADLVNIRFDFGWGLLAFQQGLSAALIAEASRPDSPLANQVVVNRLVTLQGQVQQLFDLLQQPPPSAAPSATPPASAAPVSTSPASQRPAPVPSPAPTGEYHSCFISYSSQDQHFADQLYSDLVAAGVTCWYAPEDMAIGDRIRKTIYTAIGRLDKLLIILSRHSIASDWVEGEVERAFERERQQKETVLFPIRLDDDVMQTDQAWASDIRRIRHIGDFTHWNEPTSYQHGLQRLLRDLRVDGNTPNTAEHGARDDTR
ncbi:MAG: TIR domain-containing protein [Anaerolineae bacterium]